MIEIQELSGSYSPSDSRIVMLVVDGLGGAPHPRTGKSELETASLPNLDRLARESACGLTIPVLPGITPGSGPGHLALFGYDPLKYLIGRGALEAMGVGEVDFVEGDVVARGNFCTVDNKGVLKDRRAGRVASAVSGPLCEALDKICVDALEVSVYLVKDHRFVLRLRGEGLSGEVNETDPQRIGVPPLAAKGITTRGNRTAMAVNEFVRQARDVLVNEDLANMVLLRGFSGYPSLPSMGDIFRLNPASIAAYPMYRGLTSIAGMKTLDTGVTFDDELETLENHFGNHDFFYIHYKAADAAGEDGDFEGKVRALEELDKKIPRLLELDPEVLVIAGDHATPAIMASHSWHNVPLLVRSEWTLGENVERFSERAFAVGSLGTMPAVGVMALALAHAGKLAKFGA